MPCGLPQHGGTVLAAARVYYPAEPLVLGELDPIDEWGAGGVVCWRATWGATHHDLAEPGVIVAGAVPQGPDVPGGALYFSWTWETGTGARTGVVVDGAGGSLQLPPTKHVAVKVFGPRQPDFAVFSINATEPTGRLAASAPNPNVQIINGWAYAAHDADAAAGVGDTATFTERRTIAPGAPGQLFFRPPFARRVAIYAERCNANLVLHTVPLIAGPPIPTAFEVPMSGLADGVLVSLPQGPAVPCSVVWGLQL